MTKNPILWLLLAAVIFLAGAAGSIAAWKAPGGRQVEIWQDREVICRLDLTDDKQPLQIETEYEGRKNIVTVEQGQVWISYAECPDHTCRTWVCFNHCRSLWYAFPTI